LNCSSFSKSFSDAAQNTTSASRSVGGGVGVEDYPLFRHNGTREWPHDSKPHYNAKQEYGSIYGCLRRVSHPWYLFKASQT